MGAGTALLRFEHAVIRGPLEYEMGNAIHIEIASARFASIAMTFSFGR